MKSIGIEIDKKRVVCFAIEKLGDGSFNKLKTAVKYFELSDEYSHTAILSFQAEVLAYFKEINPDKIGILTRQSKGKFASAAVSFKIEGLLQCYREMNCLFVTKPTLNAFFKKNALPYSFDHNYQEMAAKLAFFLNQ